MPARAPIDINATPVDGSSLSSGPRNHAREMSADLLLDAHNLFDRMSVAGNDKRANRFAQSIIFEGDTAAAVGAAMAGYDPEENQSQEVVLDLDGFPLYHEFQEDYDLKEEDELDIDGSLCSRTSSPTKSHSRFNTKKVVEEVGEGEKPRSRWKTNSKKEDKRDEASIALIAAVESMMTKKDSRKEKHRQDKEEQMNAFMEIQRRRLEMEEENQAKMLEMEAEKQAKMLEIEVADAKTKAKEAALASMMTGVEIMKVDLNTVSPRKRLWFEKM
ncbi:C2 domain-containing protein [Hordeum vulgare]|nr:C2 domain-containing protein [Hordeum vulgare]